MAELVPISRWEKLGIAPSDIVNNFNFNFKLNLKITPGHIVSRWKVF